MSDLKSGDVVSHSLIEDAVKYHGQNLCEALRADQPELWPTLKPDMGRELTPAKRRPAEEKDAQFRKRMLTFISRKADMIFKPVANLDSLRAARDSLDEERETASCGRMPPIETWLEGDMRGRKQRFIDSLQVGDILYANVQSLQENCLILVLLCTSDSHPGTGHFCHKRDEHK